MTESKRKNEQIEVLRIVCERLSEKNIPYMVTGSIASSRYGRPRMTRDIDVVIDVEPRDAAQIHALFSSDFHADPLLIESEIARKGMFNIFHRSYFVKVDFVVCKDKDYRKLEFSRRQLNQIEGIECSIVSVEDLIVSKLAWARESLSETQLTDVKQVLKLARNVDLDYIEHWVKQLGLEDVYRKIER